VTVAFPAPLAAEVTVIQLELLEAVQLQELPPLIQMAPVAPFASNFRLVGATAKPQPVPACATVRVWPATVTVPVRAALPLLAGTLKLAVPLPVTLPADARVIQLALLPAVHVHVLPVVTVKLVVCAPDNRARVVGDTV
jgi:hypothetical protein